MDVALLIDAITRQTTVLIAQLSTSAGIRAPLSHIANQVFLDLASEIEAQGVGRKVAADMFGLALRSYQKKVQRLTESASIRNRTLWEAVFDFLEEQGSVTRERLLARFRQDPAEDVAAVVNDLVSEGIACYTGRGANTVYGLTPDTGRRRIASGRSVESAEALVWLSLYRQAMSPQEIRASLALDTAEVDTALQSLEREGRIRESRGKYWADTFLVPVGAAKGWEVAVFDHFSAMTRAIAAKVQRADPKSVADDVVGGATLTFELSGTHPMRAEVRGLLRRVRSDVNELWLRVGEHNEKNPIAEADKELVSFYFGQNVQDASVEEQEHTGA
jgi:hypothetical protein